MEKTYLSGDGCVICGTAEAVPLPGPSSHADSLERTYPTWNQYGFTEFAQPVTAQNTKRSEICIERGPPC
jgi:hypothetical protein